MDKASKNDRYNKIIGYNTMHFTTIVDSSAAESMAMQYVAPYTACSMLNFEEIWVYMRCCIWWFEQTCCYYRQMSFY